MTTRELDRTPDLAELVTAARDAGHEVILIERPMPDAVSIAGLGRAFEIVSAEGGAALEDASGRRLDFEPGGERLAAAARLWRRFAASWEEPPRRLPGTGLAALGGFAFRPDREPAEPWRGFPAILLRVPALTVTRVRGRTFASTAVAAAEELLELPRAFAAPPSRHLEVAAVRPVAAWCGAVRAATARLRRGDASKVVLAREEVARGDGAISAGRVAGALRAGYPSCYTYLVAGADGTAFAGASPELLVRRAGGRATSQPMAGSIRRGRDEAEDERLTRRLLASAKDRAEHELVARHVRAALEPLSMRLRPPASAEVVRFTNIQHLATTFEARLRAPAASALELAAALHPTPAVCGWPLGESLDLIDELEEMERGWYAGAVGWIDGSGDGEFAVALRCGLLWEDGARLYAGAGVMPDSDPLRELEETEVKFQALLGALTG